METPEAFPNKKRCYTDESGSNVSYDREYARAPGGERVVGEAYGTKFGRMNLAAGQTEGRTVAPVCYPRNTNSEIIEFRFEEKPTPLLPPGSAAIMDNAQFHRKGILREIASRYGVMVLFLPPYSPEFNPIEHLWANIKKRLKKNIRNYDSFEDALEAALDVYS